MNTYTFALSFLDETTHFIGVAPVEILAKSPQEAADRLRDLKHNREWLRTVPVLDIQDDEDLDGIVAGDFLLMQETTIAPPDSPESARALQDEASTPHNDEHAETRRAS